MIPSMKTIFSTLALLCCLCTAHARAQQYTYTSSWPAHSYQSVDNALHCWVAAFTNQFGVAAPTCSKANNYASCSYDGQWFGTLSWSSTVNLSSGWWAGYLDNSLSGRMGYMAWDSSQQPRWNGYSWTMYKVQYYAYNGHGQGICTLYAMPAGNYPGSNTYATYSGSAF